MAVARETGLLEAPDDFVNIGHGTSDDAAGAKPDDHAVHFSACIGLFFFCGLSADPCSCWSAAVEGRRTSPAPSPNLGRLCSRCPEVTKRVINCSRVSPRAHSGTCPYVRVVIAEERADVCGLSETGEDHPVDVGRFDATTVELGAAERRRSELCPWERGYRRNLEEEAPTGETHEVWH